MRLLESSFATDLPGEPTHGMASRSVEAAWAAVAPTPVALPEVLAVSAPLAAAFGLTDADLSGDAFRDLLAGNAVPSGVQPVATNYGGHQFGHWAGQLGDGRALLLGDVEAQDGSRWELQLKGAGRTPFSRHADGRAVLRSSLREFVASEAMHALGVPTTRALALVATGDAVVRDLLYDGNARPEPGAVVARMAPSFLRFGHFQLPASRGDTPLLAALVDHAMRRHFPAFTGPHARADWFAEVARRTGDMVAHWMRVGFVHGVLNTDNMSALGLTIDYGPFGFLDDFDPHWTPNTTDLPGRRYRYAAQPQVVHWNLSALASALAPLFPDGGPLEAGLAAYVAAFQQAQARACADKLGFADWRAEDASLMQALYAWLQEAEVDFSLFFRALGDLVGRGAATDALAGVEVEPLAAFSAAFYDAAKAERHAQGLVHWLARYRARLAADPQSPFQRQARMDAANPLYVPRNWLLQQAIEAAEQGDLGELNALLTALAQPYTPQPGAARFAARRPEWAKNKPGCSALSCSS